MAGPPSSLDLQWHGGLGPSFKARVDDGVLLVQGHSASSSVRPSARNWEELLHLLREIGACDWEPRYSSNTILFDCISWSAEIEAPGISVNSSGYGAFPPDDGLHRLLDFVAGLAGVVREH